jgi:hypothetical protein
MIGRGLLTSCEELWGYEHSLRGGVYNILNNFAEATKEENIPETSMAGSVAPASPKPSGHRAGGSPDSSTFDPSL